MRKRVFVIFSVVVLFSTLQLFAGGKSESSIHGKVRIGFLPDPGALPILLMENVEAIPFMSARERDAALSTGELDGISGDMIGLLNYQKSGFPLKILTLTECRFLIVVHPYFADEEIYQVGISENTVIEYLVDTLLAGERVEKIAIPQVPVRLEMLRAGKLPMACLSDGLAWPLISEGFQIVRDQAATDLTPTILAFSNEYLEKHPESIAALKDSWNEAVKLINVDPGQYHPMLLNAIRLPESRDFPMPLFKEITLPTEEYFDSVVAWFEAKYGTSLNISLNEVVIH